MTNAGAQSAANRVEQTGRQASRSRWVQLLARTGYAAKGIVYLIVGGFAVAAAVGTGGGTTDRTGAVRAIYDQPLGKFWLVLVAVGWLGFALWSLLEAWLDPEGEGSGAKGIAARVGYAVVGCSYAGLAITALRLVAGSGGGGTSSSAQTQGWTARLLAHGWGVALVIAAGLVVLGVAAYLFYTAYSARFEKHLASPGNGAIAGWVRRLGRAGYAALGVVFTIIGIFLIAAAVQHNPGEAIGLDGALRTLARQPLGHVLLGIVALGLFAYGIYSFAEARYRRLTPA